MVAMALAMLTVAFVVALFYSAVNLSLAVVSRSKRVCQNCFLLSGEFSPTLVI